MTELSQENFNTVVSDLGQLISGFRTLEGRLTSADAQIATLSGRLTSVESENVTLKGRLDVTDSRFVASEAELATHRVQIEALHTQQLTSQAKIEVLTKLAEAAAAGVKKSVTLIDDKHKSRPTFDSKSNDPKDTPLSRISELARKMCQLYTREISRRKISSELVQRSEGQTDKSRSGKT